MGVLSRGDIVQGILSRGDIVRGDIVRGDVVRGDIVRGDIVRGDIVLEPDTYTLVTLHSRDRKICYLKQTSRNMNNHVKKIKPAIIKN